MSKELTQIFDFEESPVRVVVQNEQPWFVAADVCRVLDLTNPTMATQGLDDDEKNTLRITEGIRGRGNPNLNIISESGLYALIFTSRKAKARAFRRWVTSEVLPAIRKAGRYEAEQALQASERGRLGKLRSLLLEAGQGVLAHKVSPGQAQAIAITAQRYLETLKLEGDALGYEKVLGLPDGEGPDGLLSPRGKAAELLQDVPQPPLSRTETEQPSLQGDPASQQEALGGTPSGAANGLRKGQQDEAEDNLQRHGDTSDAH